MDIYQYLNSKDIADYLRSMDYSFSIVEASYLIYQCRRLNLEQKMNVWQEVIDSYPDCPYERMEIRTDSFHQCLKDYINLNRRILEEFYIQESRAIYWYCWHEMEQDEWYCSVEDDAAFSNYTACYKSFIKEIQDRHFNMDALEQLTFKKTWLNPVEHYGEYIDVEVNSSYEVTKISKSNLSEEERTVDCLFEHMWIDIPTPFRRGDIVVSNEGNGYVKRNSPFVLNALATWDSSELLDNGFGTNDYLVEYAEERQQRFLKNGTPMDMWAKGYRNNEKGYVDNLEQNTYLELEYYRGTLRGTEQFLTTIGRFLKGEITYPNLRSEYYCKSQEGELPFFERQLENLFGEKEIDTKKVFIGGTKRMELLQPAIYEELNRIMRNNYQVVIGDCRGVDTLVQQYLKRRGYENVVVYASGNKVRNNVGGWKVCYVPAELELTPFEFYRQKDIAMAEVADCGIMVWDGKSKGTYRNIQDLHERGKEVKILLS